MPNGPHDARALVDVVVRSVGLSRTQTTSRSITDLVLHFKKKQETFRLTEMSFRTSCADFRTPYVQILVRLMCIF